MCPKILIFNFYFSTTTFLSPKELEASSREAAEAVASLQVSTDTTEMDQFSDLFNVTSCSEPFTLIDQSISDQPQFGMTQLTASDHNNLENNTVTKMTNLKPAGHQEPVFSLLQSTSSNPTLGMKLFALR